MGALDVRGNEGVPSAALLCLSFLPTPTLTHIHARARTHTHTHTLTHSLTHAHAHSRARWQTAYYDDLAEKDEAFWNALLRAHVVDAAVATVVARPSAAMSEELQAAVAERTQQRVDEARRRRGGMWRNVAECDWADWPLWRDVV